MDGGPIFFAYEIPPVPEPVVEAPKGLTKADKVLYKALQANQ